MNPRRLALSLALPFILPTIAYAADPSLLVQEQQEAWQDTLNQQRIESLRQTQAAEASSDILAPASSTSVPLAAPPNLPIQPATQPQTQQPAIDTPVTSCLSTQHIKLADLSDLKSSVQNQLRQQAASLSSTELAQDLTQLKPLSSPNQPSCISVAKANDLVRSITEAYLEAGFFKITIQPETVDKANSVWRIHVAKIDAIDNQTDLPTTRLFGNLVGTPANIAWLDQVVGNGERIIDGQLLLDIYPVGPQGEDVRIKVSQQGDIDSVSTDLEWRYDPDDSYGHHQIKLHASLRNLFGQADLTSLSVQQSLASNYGYDEDNQRRSASVYSIVPNGRWQWSGMLAADQNKRTTVLPNSVLEQTGDSWQANVRGDFTLSRNQNSITTAYGQVAHQDVTSELLGSQLDTQSPKLSSARLGMTHTRLFNHRSSIKPNQSISGAAVLDVSAEKAFGNHDNPATKAGLSDDYLRWILSGYLSHRHTILGTDKVLGYLQMTHVLQGQYTDDNVFGVTQQSLGSAYSGVRGIDNISNSAASGLSLRNTLSFEPTAASWQNFGQQRVRWSPYVGVDYGMLKYADTANDKRSNSDAVSGTLGMTLTGYDVKGLAADRRWQLDVGASRAHVDYGDPAVDGNQDTEISAAWQWYF